MKIIAEKILKEHKLRNTPIRIAVLSYFKESNSALSHANLEQYFNNQLLKSISGIFFRKKNIIFS